MIRPALALLLGTLAAPAWAAVPELAVEGTCDGLARSTGKPDLLPRCLADEAAALVRLEAAWDAVPIDIAGGCSAAVLDSGQPSYQILALCIEDGLATAGLPSPFPSEAP